MTEILTQINGFASFDDISATESNNAIVLTKREANANLNVTAGNSIFGFNASYPYSTTTVNTYTNMISAVDKINNHMTAQGITDIIASVQNSRINISSTRSSLDFGNTDSQQLCRLTNWHTNYINLWCTKHI